MLFDMSYTVSPVVNASNSFRFVFGKFEKVKIASVTYDQSVAISGTDISSAIDISFCWGTDASQNNAVDIYPYYRDAVNRYVARRAAVTADLAGKKFVCIATGV